MTTLREIFIRHSARYPKMQCRDAVKLLYQNEFGGGHLIRDLQKCREAVLQEYAATAQMPNTPLLEDIGNGKVRVMLAALDCHGYTPQQLAEDFIAASAQTQGRMDCFREKLDFLIQLTGEGALPFSQSELLDYLKSYADEGYPMVSHSNEYRQNYCPAYRVFDRRFLPVRLREL